MVSALACAWEVQGKKLAPIKKISSLESVEKDYQFFLQMIMWREAMNVLMESVIDQFKLKSGMNKC